MNYFFILVAALLAYIISTLSGGGGSLLLVPVVSFLLGAKVTAPVINLGNLLGAPVRLYLFWKDIELEGNQILCSRCCGGRGGRRTAVQ
ncbi:hypothetical protein [Pontibacter sp. 172403-2]|uniref:hypothetical protein n=1 Tax=Pontibacter rufus TaxID=2791028 RepID=UPI001E55775C|nr:hypothetical protein [Pontibacter sp. 172403-2]